MENVRHRHDQNLVRTNREVELERFNNSVQFILDYIDYHSNTFEFYARGRKLSIYSKRNIVISRADAIFLWLINRQKSADNFILGRSLFAEIYFCHLLNDIFSDTRYKFMMLPTYLDDSIHGGKGGDLLLYEMDNVSGSILPILVIDITTSKSKRSITRKRSGLPINRALDVPVVILPISRINIDLSEGSTCDNIYYLDHVLRRYILDGSYNKVAPLVGISERGKAKFQREVLRVFLRSIEKCINRLNQHGLFIKFEDVKCTISELHNGL